MGLEGADQRLHGFQIHQDVLAAHQARQENLRPRRGALERTSALTVSHRRFRCSRTRRRERTSNNLPASCASWPRASRRRRPVHQVGIRNAAGSASPLASSSGEIPALASAPMSRAGGMRRATRRTALCRQRHGDLAIAGDRCPRHQARCIDRETMRDNASMLVNSANDPDAAGRWRRHRQHPPRGDEPMQRQRFGAELIGDDAADPIDQIGQIGEAEPSWATAGQSSGGAVAKEGRPANTCIYNNCIITYCAAAAGGARRMSWSSLFHAER